MDLLSNDFRCCGLRDFESNRTVILSPDQCRAARAWLGLPQAELARSAGIGLSTLRSFEGQGTRPLDEGLLHAVRTALEARGVRFVDDEPSESGIMVSSPDEA